MNLNLKMMMIKLYKNLKQNSLTGNHEQPKVDTLSHRQVKNLMDLIKPTKHSKAQKHPKVIDHQNLRNLSLNLVIIMINK